MTKDKKSVKSKKLKCKILISLCALLLLGFSISLYVSNNCIKITRYTLESDKVTAPVRFAVISDLHSKKFGESNEQLYSKIEEQNPDVILTVGDMISDRNMNSEGIDYLTEVLAELCSIAPVYCSLGNHERHSSMLEEIKEAITNSGATLLEYSYEDISINGNDFRLFGVSYFLSWDYDINNFIHNTLKIEEDVFSLLLCHNPEFYIWGINRYRIDLILSGHTHGGMLKLPLLGPVYAPEQGWFPKYGAGFYKEENGTLAVTTGLGSSPEYMPRIFNRPEIMIIDVK